MKWKEEVDDLINSIRIDYKSAHVANALDVLAERLARVEEATAERIVDPAIHVSPRLAISAHNEPPGVNVNSQILARGKGVELGIEFAVAWLRERAKSYEKGLPSSLLLHAQRACVETLIAAADDLEKGEKP